MTDSHGSYFQQASRAVHTRLCRHCNDNKESRASAVQPALRIRLLQLQVTAASNRLSTRQLGTSHAITPGERIDNRSIS